MPDEGRTIALYGDSGSGKTTQIGELAKYHFKRDRRRLRLYAADMGGYDTILPLVKLGIIEVVPYYGDRDDPWLWTNMAVKGLDLNGDPLPADIAAVAYDSATSIGEALLDACAGSDFKIGSQTTQKFTVTKGDASLKVGLTNENHFGVVQGFLLSRIWQSTWLSRQGVDVLWTFSVLRGEKADETPILGPKLAGKALTAAIPKWFKFTFRIVSRPAADMPAVHRLYMQEQPEPSGSVSFGNARYPIDAVTELPPYIEPASLITALELVDRGQGEAYERLKEELDL